MNRAQRVVIAVTCFALAAFLFLYFGPFARSGPYVGDLKYQNPNNWNPFARQVVWSGTSANDPVKPVPGWVIPILLGGFGVFVLMGEPRKQREEREQ